MANAEARHACIHALVGLVKKDKACQHAISYYSVWGIRSSSSGSFRPFEAYHSSKAAAGLVDNHMQVSNTDLGALYGAISPTAAAWLCVFCWDPE